MDVIILIILYGFFLFISLHCLLLSNLFKNMYLVLFSEKVYNGMLKALPFFSQHQKVNAQWPCTGFAGCLLRQCLVTESCGQKRANLLQPIKYDSLSFNSLTSFTIQTSLLGNSHCSLVRILWVCVCTYVCMFIQCIHRNYANGYLFDLRRIYCKALRNFLFSKSFWNWSQRTFSLHK